MEKYEEDHVMNSKRPIGSEMDPLVVNVDDPVGTVVIEHMKGIIEGVVEPE